MNVQQTILHEEIETRYLSYALSTIVSRALPDVRDGLKPVHRRILFAMHSIGASQAARFVKSARVVGEVIGKYHPHGDVAVYDAMVRMAQDFSLRYPLVEGQGNFGSLDGDNAAAMRYTESRLSSMAEEFFTDLRQATVAFQRNYDASLEEPAVLPVPFPNLLINGSSGIAVGMTTSIPPHNMAEVCDALLACIDNQDIRTRDLMQIIKGPDFPTGGELLNSFSELVEIYRQGRGAIRLRGQHQVEQCKRGRVQLIITAIPYSVNKARLIERIAQLVQSRKLPLVNNVWDESTEEIRIVLELKNAQVDPVKVMAFLYKYTPLEINFPLNFTCLTPEGVPERMSIKEMLLHFLDFRKDIVTRRLNFEMRQIRERMHLLEGFLAIFDCLDEAIALIRQADSRASAKQALMERFKLDGQQADAILELRLQSLVRLEEQKLRTELAERSQRRAHIEHILSREELIWQEVRQELASVKKRYGDARRTQIVQEPHDLLFSTEDFVEHEEVWIVLTRMGRLKRLKNYAPETFLLREDDRIFTAFAADSRDHVAFFSNLGRVYIVPVYELPASGKGYGEPIQTIFSFQDGERAVAVMALSKDTHGPDANAEDAAMLREVAMEQATAPVADGVLDSGIQLGLFNGARQVEALRGAPTLADAPGVPMAPGVVLITKAGQGLRLPYSQLQEVTLRAGRQVIKLEPADELVQVVTGESHMLVLATARRVVVISRDEIAQLAGPGKGVRLMSPDPSGVCYAAAVRREDRIWVQTPDGARRDYAVNYFLTLRRGAKGRFIKGGIQDIGVQSSETTPT